MSLYNLTVNYDPAKLYRDLFSEILWYTPNPVQPKPPTSPSPAQRIANEVAQLAKDHSANLGEITRAVNEVEAERRTTVEKAVKGALDIAKLGSPKARRFRLAFQVSDKSVKVVEGIEFADERTDKSKEGYETRVYVGPLPAGNPLSAHSYTSMKKLREDLDNRKIVYAIDYID